MGLSVLAFFGTNGAAQGQNPYTADGWDAYPLCLFVFEDPSYQQETRNRALVCGWDQGRSFAGGGTVQLTGGNLAALAEEALARCYARGFDRCVVFALNLELSEWAAAAAEGRRAFADQGRLWRPSP
jgi:hypothetical protein